jgi:hypothetical protein
MKVSVSDAKAQLTDLVRRAEAGGEVILTRHGQPVARIMTLTAGPAAIAARTVILETARKSGAQKAGPGPQASESQDFLYGPDGLPG